MGCRNIFRRISENHRTKCCQNRRNRFTKLRYLQPHIKVYKSVKNPVVKILRFSNSNVRVTITHSKLNVTFNSLYLSHVSRVCFEYALYRYCQRLHFNSYLTICAAINHLRCTHDPICRLVMANLAFRYRCL